MGTCSGQNKQKSARDERIKTEPDRGSETGGVNCSHSSRRSGESKGLDLQIAKKKSMKKQESLKVTLSLNNAPIDKYYVKKNLRYLEGVNFKDNQFVVQHIVTGKIRIAEKLEKNETTSALVNKILYLQLNHPNLLEIYAIFLDKDNYIIISDYCNGESLLSLLQKSRGKIDEQVAAECCRQIYEVMGYLHKFGLYHGSLSLKSFEKYNKAKKQFKIKLVDWSSLFFRQELNGVNVQFLSPECCNEKQLYNAARDQWAAGMITMVLCFSTLPFQANSVQEYIDVINTSCKKEGFIQKEIEKLNGNEAIKELISQFICISPQKRIDFQQALETKWMKNQELVSKSIFQQYVQELSKKQETNFLQSCFLLMMIKQFDDQFTQTQEIFNGLDIDKNGRLTKPELMKQYQKFFNSNYKQHEITEFVNEIFEASDLNHNGDIEFSEFVIAMSNKKTIINSSNLKIIFDQINQGEPFGFNELQPYFKTKEAELKVALTEIPNEKITFDYFEKLMFDLLEEK